MSGDVVSRHRAALIALICSSVILLVSLGIRHAFGLFLQPVTMDQGWGRETFAFAIALQNLVWGISQPVTGMASDRFGARPVLIIGAVFYGFGLWLMSRAGGEALFILGAGVLIGLGQSGTTFPVLFGALSRLVPPEQRSMAMGVTMAFGSLGQFVMLPVVLGLIEGFDWQGALILLALMALLIVPLAAGLPTGSGGAESSHAETTVRQALRQALSMRDFWFLSMGYFVCGFQVVFIAIHLPAFLADEGVGSGVATTVLALIGLFNIAGSYFAGLWGGRRRKPMLLSWLYLLRGVVIVGFLLIPVSAGSAYVFGALMGLLWLSTVPLTNGTVASVWGVRHMSMLGGIVFFAHQLGAFLGGWFGGWIYDRAGNYDMVWAFAIALSVIAAVVNWPISERSADERRAT